MPQAPAYDSDGNLIQGYTPAGYRFVAAYDAEDRLRSLVYTNGAGVTFSNACAYAANSLLSEWKQFTNGVLANDIRFLWSATLPVQERDQNNAATRQYVWGASLGGGIGGLLGLMQAGQNYAYVYDGRGNVSAVLDSSQNSAATYAYDPFGQVAAASGTLDQPMQFSTKRYDGPTGLVYFGRRFYQPATGRWLSRDRLGEMAGLNAYAYVHGNPMNRIDFYGLDDGASLSLQGLGPNLSLSYGSLSGSLQTPYTPPGQSARFSDLDLQLNLKFSDNFSAVCDASKGQVGGDITLDSFDLQLTGGVQNQQFSGQAQATYNFTPNLNGQIQVSGGPGQGVTVTAGVSITPGGSDWW
jgi:RHS repeat-associated protein